MPVGSRSGPLLRGLVRVSCAHPWLTVAGALAVAVVSLLYVLSSLRLETSTRAASASC